MSEHNSRPIHPRDTVDWRKRIMSVSRYIAELEDCLEEARSIIVRQQKQIERLSAQCKEAGNESVN